MRHRRRFSESGLVRSPSFALSSHHGYLAYAHPGLGEVPTGLRLDVEWGEAVLHLPNWDVTKRIPTRVTVTCVIDCAHVCQLPSQTTCFGAAEATPFECNDQAYLLDVCLGIRYIHCSRHTAL